MKCRTPQMDTPGQVETIAGAEIEGDLNLMVRDVAKVGKGTDAG